MNDNGERIRAYVWKLEKQDLVTYGYVAKWINDGNDGCPRPANPTSPRGVGSAIRSGAEESEFPCWRVIDASYRPKDEDACTRLEREGWRLSDSTIYPSMRHLVNRKG